MFQPEILTSTPKELLKEYCKHGLAMKKIKGPRASPMQLHHSSLASAKYVNCKCPPAEILP